MNYKQIHSLLLQEQYHLQDLENKKRMIQAKNYNDVYAIFWVPPPIIPPEQRKIWNDLLEKVKTSPKPMIYVNELNKLPLIQRPLWCSDKKRKKIYVKEESWSEDVDNNKTKEAIYNISKAQTGNINKYIEHKPNWMTDDKDKTTYIDIVKTITEQVDDGKREKVIDTIMETIHLTEDKVG